MSLIDDKRILRGTMIAWRGGLSEAERQAAAAGLVETWQLERPVETPAVVSGFWPMAEELDIRPLMIELHNQGCQLCLPVVVAKKQPLVFRAWRPGDPLEALRAKRRVTAIGVGFNEQIVPEVPHGPGDQRLDWLLTDKRACAFV